MKIIDGGVTAAKGFKANGAPIGLKKNGNKDMAIIISDSPCTASGCFTTNVVKAAPVLWDMKAVNNKIFGVVANSGNANACTGQQGLDDAEATAAKLGGLIGKNAENILVCSTGVIGVNLPMDIILSGVDKVYGGVSTEGWESASQAIMTTDTYNKVIAVELELDGKSVKIGGMSKGSGMINPNMATMLCFITTDCAISKPMLDKAVKAAVADSFNMISVDGDMSTNDTVLVLANGQAENAEITDDNSEDYKKFAEAVMYIAKTLAIKCADDGEGATKLIEANVKGAADIEGAKKIALSVVSSNLLKAAIFGEDANWGRALCAMGYCGVDFDPMKVTMDFRSEKGSINLMNEGKPIVFDEDKAAEILSEHKIYIDIRLCEGEAEATAWGCDLTYDYVKINGDYRS